MFIKIFCGDSQKYLLLQSNNVTLDKRNNFIHSDLYPIMCAYIEEMSVPDGERDYTKTNDLATAFLNVARVAYNDDSILMRIDTTIADMFPNTPVQLLCPVLSDTEEAEKLLWRTDNKKDEPLSASNKKLSIVQVDENTYFTTGPVFVMNDDGKTIDRV
ncbi:MAG: hypothetical protein J6S67_26000 [Methanobrevibacter sp.]|nr:hypothetical protein [Methanobrevibacter sp.]